VLGRIHPRKCKPKPENAGTPKRPVRGTNIKTGEIVEMESLAAAEKFVNGHYQNIRQACQGNRKQAYGYRWEYV
jgi:hypothetical protein